MATSGQRRPPHTPDPASVEADPSYRPPGAEPRPQSPSDAAASTAIHQAPIAGPADPRLGSVRGEEHAAPPPSTRLGPKLWIIAGLLVVVAVVAVAVG